MKMFCLFSTGIPFPNKVAVHNLDLPMNEKDEIHCIDVLQALLKRVLGKHILFAQKNFFMSISLVFIGLKLGLQVT